MRRKLACLVPTDNTNGVPRKMLAPAPRLCGSSVLAAALAMRPDPEPHPSPSHCSPALSADVVQPTHLPRMPVRPLPP